MTQLGSTQDPLVMSALDPGWESRNTKDSTNGKKQELRKIMTSLFFLKKDVNLT